MTILQFIERCENMTNGETVGYWHFAVSYENEQIIIYWRGKPAIKCTNLYEIRLAILSMYNLYHLEYTRDYIVPDTHLASTEVTHD